MSLPRPCLSCGTLSPDAHCAEHAPHRPDLRRGRDRSHVGRGGAWDRLSKRARALQDWCSDCGTRDDLTADHLPSAWAKVAARQTLTLHDVEVCCRPCNARRGPAQVGSARFEAWQREPTSTSTRGHSEAEKGHRAPGARPGASNALVATS